MTFETIQETSCADDCQSEWNMWEWCHSCIKTTYDLWETAALQSHVFIAGLSLWWQTRVNKCAARAKHCKWRMIQKWCKAQNTLTRKVNATEKCSNSDMLQSWRNKWKRKTLKMPKNTTKWKGEMLHVHLKPASHQASRRMGQDPLHTSTEFIPKT